jgi:hypothetical protein
LPESDSRPLHLHTLNSLIADLASGRSVQTGGGNVFVLPDDRTRSALEWYRRKGPTGWAANVSARDGEDLVDSILGQPPQLRGLPARPAGSNKRRLRLKRMEAHRFAGVHKFGTPGAAPENYVHEFASTFTLFEGRNGSGKTSLVNAIIWGLTGEILRSQREPEPAEDFDCWVATTDGGDERTTHRLSPLTPMPNVEQYLPDQPWVPADTWVELTFVDEAGVELPVIRRSQTRSPQGKLKETPPDLTILGVDPIAVRIGTIMPGLLPLIKIGSESELGRAVSELTGLSSLVDLADHVRRAKAKIDKDSVKSKTGERDRADRDYTTAKGDLENITLAHPSLTPAQAIPQPSDDKGIEVTLDEITKHFEGAKTTAFESALDILGERFDPANLALLSDLEKNVGRALERVSRPQDLRSAARLRALRQLKPDELDAVAAKIQEVLAEAKSLDALARNPSRAARLRLYARVATWIADHPDPERKGDKCVVCGGDLEHALDHEIGEPVLKHLQEIASDAVLLSQTLSHWSENAQGNIMRSVRPALRAEMVVDLPGHPCDLLRNAFIDELFEFDPFRGALMDVKTQTASALDETVRAHAALADPIEIALPAMCDKLDEMLRRLDRAIRFARWRQGNDTLVRDIAVRVLGRVPKGGEPSEKATLSGKLLELDATVKAAKPISDALVQCNRLKKHLKSRRDAEARLVAYGVASAALGNLASLGQLADEQVDQLRKSLRKDAAVWRSRIYLGAFPDRGLSP